ncbi:hypothetical protein [Streptosporangium roseum]|uniref:hypothetical protein n=1 Tax=Streptosporangium roseum TaxID=2001 RepID=UPI0004CCDD78|nr:hypothetical protein [Streptosporangium roseum]
MPASVHDGVLDPAELDVEGDGPGHLADGEVALHDPVGTVLPADEASSAALDRLTGRHPGTLRVVNG